MKKIKTYGLCVLAVICTAVCLCSCTLFRHLETIVGEWEYDENSEITYTFNEDGTGVYVLPSLKMEFTYELKDDEIDITYEGLDTVTFKYVLDGTKLNIKDVNGEDNFYHKKL